MSSGLGLGANQDLSFPFSNTVGVMWQYYVIYDLTYDLFYDLISLNERKFVRMR